MKFSVPCPQSLLEITASDGAVIRLRRHGNPNGVRLILSHGNGFAIDAYYPFWQRFLADYDVLVFDQRNHGLNPRSKGNHTLEQMAIDLSVILSRVDEAFGRKAIVGAFHSLSTLASLIHGITYSYPWQALVLFDPPLAPPPGHRLFEMATKYQKIMAKWALNRPRHFVAREELADYFRQTRRMRNCVPGAVELMAKSITRRAPEGGFELSCPPEYEFVDLSGEYPFASLDGNVSTRRPHLHHQQRSRRGGCQSTGPCLPRGR